MKRQATILAAFVVLAGCATPVSLIPTGGSRADGTVKLSYEYGLFDKPVIDQSQAQVSAE